MRKIVGQVFGTTARACDAYFILTALLMLIVILGAVGYGMYLAAHNLKF